MDGGIDITGSSRPWLAQDEDFHVSPTGGLAEEILLCGHFEVLTTTDTKFRFTLHRYNILRSYWD